MRLIFVRHGQTTWNLASRYQGHADSDLSELGLIQAERVGNRLKDTRIDAVYSSDLKRASDTAEAIAEHHGLSVRTDPRLREVCFGEWEGLTVSEIKELYPEAFANYRKDSVTYRSPGGERLEALQARVVEVVNEIVRAHPDETVVIATSGGPIRAFLCYALNVPLATFRKVSLDNAGITSYRRRADDDWVLETLNDACHLEGLAAPSLAHDETAADKA